MPVALAGETISNPSEYISQTLAMAAKDHAAFLNRLDELHKDATLSPAEKWQVKYLDAWEAMFEGDYPSSQQQFLDIIAHSGNSDLAFKSSALLLSNYSINRQYSEAFSLANRLTEQLPDIKDPQVRGQVLANLSQAFNLAGQSDLALKYAQMHIESTPPGENLCKPLTEQVVALSNAGKVSSNSPELKQAIDACIAADLPLNANALWLTKGEHLLKEGKARADLTLIDKIMGSIRESRFHPHIVSSLAQKAQAYEKLGQDEQAKNSALAAVAAGEKDGMSEWLRDAYQVLYNVAKRQGDDPEALKYYEHYVAQDQGYLNDISARTLAFQLAKQQVLAKKLEAEELSKQNSILKLQQQLDAKAVETGRLYIVLLLIGLTGIVLWLLRLKHSQMRFKRMATRDGLTGILNHQHFIDESERQLRQLERKAVHASLLWMDLDHFKQINDTHGHAAGDAVLRHVVRVCNEHLRPGDLFGRLGGEEFGILLLECERDSAIAIADRIRLAVEANPLDHEGMMMTVSASIGVASSCNAGHALQRLCRRADAALYRAKRDGRNRVIADAGEGTSVFA
ncbi:MAG: GGDEF domain-containing protein [Lysobacterales bacterium 14-68-21]|nr:MAG: GGDEF domain-containing protein [Xanthomonadales bacterium 15-68-25]OZB63801.1 MAG: GGDEF domain-containing protein [Xanthomonadales bacterium 14-68-21]